MTYIRPRNDLYTPSDTSILLVDPYNDFLSKGGKAWPRVKDVATKVDLLDDLREVVSTARAMGYRLFFEAQRQAASVISAHSAEETPLFAIHREEGTCRTLAIAPLVKNL